MLALTIDSHQCSTSLYQTKQASCHLLSLNTAPSGAAGAGVSYWQIISISHTRIYCCSFIILNYLQQGSYVFGSVCLCVCVIRSVCKHQGVKVSNEF